MMRAFLFGLSLGIFTSITPLGGTLLVAGVFGVSGVLYITAILAADEE